MSRFGAPAPQLPISNEEIQAFQMPKIEPGMTVVYYQPYQLDAAKPTIGFVVEVSQRNIRVYVPVNGLIRDGVRHIDDPRLRINADHRENGAWDYTARDLELNALLKARRPRKEEGPPHAETN